MARRSHIALAVLLSIVGSQALSADRVQRVHFARGASSTVIKGSVNGYAVANYLVGARAGQSLLVSLKTSNASSYFSVTAPSAQAAMFMGETSGNSFSGQLPTTGDYKVQVYLMRNAARRNETANYTLKIGVH